MTIIDSAKHRRNGMIAYLERNQRNIQFVALTTAQAKVAKKVIKKLQNCSSLLEVSFLLLSFFSPPLIDVTSVMRRAGNKNILERWALLELAAGRLISLSLRLFPYYSFAIITRTWTQKTGVWWPTLHGCLSLFSDVCVGAPLPANKYNQSPIYIQIGFSPSS